jgi:cysteine desulfurase / selenocysteine lyase
MTTSLVQRRSAMSLDDFRARFPALDKFTHMDVAARSPISSAVFDAASAHLQERLSGKVDKASWFACQERVRTSFAELVNASPDEIAITKNVSEGINTIANAIPWRPGDSVVVCTGFEHPNNIYPWVHLARSGVELVDVPASPTGDLPVTAIVSSLRPHTRAVAVASVSFSTGFRADLQALGRACRGRDVMLVVDAAQSVGVLHTDVEDEMVDALAVSTQKGLTALYGLGFLYVRRAWSERLHPAYLARFGVDLEDSHEADYVPDTVPRLAQGARRFEVGNPNFPGLASVDVAIADLLSVGTKKIEQHVLNLADRLAFGLSKTGLSCIKAEPQQRSHIVTVRAAPGFNAQDLHDWLQAERVQVSVRRGNLRFSLHGYNNATDVERAVDLCSAWVARNGKQK